MRSCRFLASAVLAIIALHAPASWAQDSAAPRPSFHDAKADRWFSTREDRRTLVITDGSGGIYGVYDPLFDSDGGREGTVTAIRLATNVEMRHFKRERPGPYIVLSYSGGGLLVVSVDQYAAVRPRRCSDRGAAIVSRNIACKIDLAAAKVRSLDALNEKFLSDGPSTIAPIEVAVPCSDIVIHVEADGRTIWAAGKSGARLWTTDPFERAGMKPYRYRRPLIWTVSPAAMPSSGRCETRGRLVVRLRYSSSQFGDLDARTGQFTFMGQD